MTETPAKSKRALTKRATATAKTKTRKKNVPSPPCGGGLMGGRSRNGRGSDGADTKSIQASPRVLVSSRRAAASHLRTRDVSVPLLGHGSRVEARRRLLGEPDTVDAMVRGPESQRRARHGIRSRCHLRPDCVEFLPRSGCDRNGIHLRKSRRKLSRGGTRRA